MPNPMLLLSGTGMMLVAVAAVLYWKKKTKTHSRIFLYGGMLWIAAAVAKEFLDFILGIPLHDLFAAIPYWAALLLLSVYMGLKTGLLESGAAYLFAKKNIRGIDYRKAVAFGIGFSSAEALLLGLASFIGILIFTLFPEAMEALPLPQQDILMNQLEMSTLVVFAPVVERISALFIHVFSMLLVFLSIRSKNTNYLVFSIAFKALVDGLTLWVIRIFGTATLMGIYLTEIPAAALGVVSFFGIRMVRKRFVRLRLRIA